MPVTFHNKYPVWRLRQRLLLKQLVARVQLRILIPTQVSAEIKQLSIFLFIILLSLHSYHEPTARRVSTSLAGQT